MGSACSSDANKVQTTTEAVNDMQNVMGSPVPGAAGIAAPATGPDGLVGFPHQRSFNDHNSHMLPPCGGDGLPPCGQEIPPCGQPIECVGGAQPFSHDAYNASPIISGMGAPMPVGYDQPVICEGPHCAQPTHKQLRPGVYQSLTDPTDIIDTTVHVASLDGIPESISVRQSTGEVVRVSTNSRHSRRPSGGQRMSQMSQRQHENQPRGSNNLIVARMEPVDQEQPREEEREEEPKMEEAPKTEKKKSSKKNKRSRWRRTNKGRGGGR